MLTLVRNDECADYMKEKLDLFIEKNIDIRKYHLTNG